MKDSSSVSSRDLALAKEIARRLAEQYEPRFFAVTLFSSPAREATDE